MKNKIIHNIQAFLLLPVCFASSLTVVIVWIETPIFRLFNPKYKLPQDEAWIDVAPISKSLYKFFIWYAETFLNINKIETKGEFTVLLSLMIAGMLFWMIIISIIFKLF